MKEEGWRPDSSAWMWNESRNPFFLYNFSYCPDFLISSDSWQSSTIRGAVSAGHGVSLPATPLLGCPGPSMAAEGLLAWCPLKWILRGWEAVRTTWIVGTKLVSIIVLTWYEIEMRSENESDSESFNILFLTSLQSCIFNLIDHFFLCHMNYEVDLLQICYLYILVVLQAVFTWIWLKTVFFSVCWRLYNERGKMCILIEYIHRVENAVYHISYIALGLIVSSYTLIYFWDK